MCIEILTLPNVIHRSIQLPWDHYYFNKSQWVEWIIVTKVSCLLITTIYNFYLTILLKLTKGYFSSFFSNNPKLWYSFGPNSYAHSLQSQKYSLFQSQMINCYIFLELTNDSRLSNYSRNILTKYREI